MKTNFQQKLIISFLIIFILFTAGIVAFEQRDAKRYKTEALKERLDAYADAIALYIDREGSADSIDSLLELLPNNLRLTLIDRQGNVVYDNAMTDLESMENHAERPEIKEASSTGSGTYIRNSASVSQPYLYYAKDAGNADIIRVALPYDIEIQSFLKPDNAFLYFIIILFLLEMGFILYVSHHFGQSIRQLRDFSIALDAEKENIMIPRFPKDELGEIGSRLVHDLNEIRRNEKLVAQEREKLLLHVQTSAEGIGFFNEDRSIAFYNGLFLQYFNIISSGSLVSGKTVIEDGCFAEVVNFLDNRGDEEYFETRVSDNGKEFMLRVNIFEDRSFEIILTDITAKEKTRRLKQEMTGNIAHELRTPVTSIRGFLEIVLGNNLSKEKTREYLERAYSQTKTLSELISDMSLLTRIDEKHDKFKTTAVNIDKVIEKVRNDTSSSLAEKDITFINEIPAEINVEGNESLIYSIFRNLTDNVIRHAGEHVTITTKTTEESNGFINISFSDNGKGIEDKKHLDRLFERFYRVNEGRTRDTGGSGLGLSIVKNTILLHGGNISVRNHRGGGLEFRFTLPKARQI